MKELFNPDARIHRAYFRLAGSLLLTIGILVTLLLPGCSERERKNPFDPGSHFKVPIDLSLSPVGTQVTLTWSVTGLEDYAGFRIYRAVDDSTQMELFQELPASVSTYTDTSVQFYHWYYYRVSVLGHGVESDPSPMQKTYPGPGTPYILSRYGYSIYQLSYDLLHTLMRANTFLATKNWAWNPGAGIIWLATAQFRFVTRFRLEVGQEDLFLEKPFQRPEDLTFNADKSHLYVLDTRKRLIYTLVQGQVTDSIPIPQGDYLEIRTGWQNTLWLLGKTHLRVFNESGDSLFAFPFDFGQEGADLCFRNNHMYLLTTNAENQTSILFTFTENQTTMNFQELSGTFFIVRQPAAESFFWLGEYMGEGNYRAVKLSEDGQRLLELPSVRSLKDIRIHPVDGSIILVRRYEDSISLYDKNGQFISTRTQIYDPIRAYIAE